MRRLRRLPLLFWLLLCWAGSASALETVTLQLKWRHQFQFAGYYAAVAKGYYQEAGLDVRLIEAKGRTTPVDAVLAGTADYGISGSDLIQARSQGKPVVVLATLLQHSGLVFLTGEQVHSVQDLSHRRVMMLPHETELIAYLKHSGIALDSIEQIPHSYDTQELVAGRVDAMSAYATGQPYALQQVRFPYHQFSPRTLGIDFYGDTLFTTESHLRAHTAQVRAFRAASLRGWEYAIAHPQEIIDLILAEYAPRANRDQLRYEAVEILRLIQADSTPIGESLPSRWKHIAEIYAESGLMAGNVSLPDFIWESPSGPTLNWLHLAIGGGLVLLLILLPLTWNYARLIRSLRLTVSERDEALATGKGNEERLRVLLNAAPVAVVVWQDGFQITGWNMEARRIFGWDRHEAVGRNVLEFLIPNDQREQFANTLHKTLTDGDATTSVNRNLTRAGRQIWCEWSNAQFLDSAGKPAGVISIAVDITERRLADEALQMANEVLQQRLVEIEKLKGDLEELAIRDGLTGLFNRRFLDETLEREVSRARREGESLSIIMLDVDHFKPLNDTRGHRAGDEVLRALAAMLLGETRGGDVACRYGGEEFLVLLPGMSHETAVARAEDWRRQFEAMQVRFGIYTLQATASFGIATFPAHGQDPDHLTAAADEALYCAKRQGRNRVVGCDTLKPRATYAD